VDNWGSIGIVPLLCFGGNELCRRAVASFLEVRSFRCVVSRYRYDDAACVVSRRSLTPVGSAIETIEITSVAEEAPEDVAPPSGPPSEYEEFGAS
jgi:hypothetical protein